MKPEITSKPGKSVLGAFVLLAVILLSSCSPATTIAPTNPPEPGATLVPQKCDPLFASNDTGLSVLRMPDGSEIYLAENTEIEFLPGGYCTGYDRLQIVLKRGRIAILSLPQGEEINVTNPQGYTATLNDTGLVDYDPKTNVLLLACTNGPCALGVDYQHQTNLVCGESRSIGSNGTISEVLPIDPAMLSVFGSWLLPKCIATATGTPIPTGTPDMAATATASCADFQGQFPLTPCPTSKP